MDITKIDKNFILCTVNENDVQWIDITNEKLQLLGIFYDNKNNQFLRMPEEISKGINQSIYELSQHTSGGRVIFKTDSPYIAIKCIEQKGWFMNHMPTVGAKGFSLYVDNYFKGIFTPDTYTMAKGEDITSFDGIIYLNDNSLKDIKIYFPLYNGVYKVYIGIKKGSEIFKSNNYKKKIVFYGSSITQGACASRPGNDYPALVSSWLNVDYINLGFSGCCLAEEKMAEYLASLSPNVYIIDYDYNAKSIEYLKETHLRLYQIIRAKNNKTPIIFISKANFEYDINNNDRRNIIKNTCDYAVKNGDTNVDFIDGEKIYGSFCRDGCTVDTIHPNDLGFYRIAEAIMPYIKKYILENS